MCSTQPAPVGCYLCLDDAPLLSLLPPLPPKQDNVLETTTIEA